MITSSITKSEDIVWRKIQDETVVIADDGRSVHVLNKTAGHIWEMCNGEYNLDEIATNLCERFEVSWEEARADVKEIITKLRDLGLLQQAEGLKGQ